MNNGFSPSNQINTPSCPYLALLDDIKTNSDFPSEINYCHRCKQPEIPTYLHQQGFCLSQHYNECIMLRDPDLKRLPKDIRFSVPANPTAKKRPLLAAIVGLGALAIYLFASALFVNHASAPSTTPLIIATTPSPTPIGLLLLSDFTPTFNAPPSATSTPIPTETTKATPSETGTPTSTQILSQSCSLYDIRYYSMAFLGGGRVQLVYDTKMDLSAYRMRDANGNLTPQLDVPGLIVWFNQSQLNDFIAFLRDPNFTNLLFIELSGSKSDHISIEIIEGNNHRCSREIILPAESALFTPTRSVKSTSTRISPTIIRSSTATRTLAPTYTRTPTITATHTRTFTPTNSATPPSTPTYTRTPTITATHMPTFTPTNSDTPTSTPTIRSTSTPTCTRTPEPLPSASLTPTPTK